MSATPLVHLHLRDEVKAFEHRVAITPEDAKLLIEKHGYKIDVESSKTRCFSDEEYKKVGCEIVPTHSWIKITNPNTFIVGLKELPDPNTVLDNITVPKFLPSQRHIYFAHCYKRQSDWKDTLSRFALAQPKGEILDLEFLNHDNGRRVAAFGVSAGFNGMAMGIITYCLQHIHNNDFNELNKQVESFETRKDLIEYIKGLLNKVEKKPTVLVLGALGRCGSGSVQCAEMCGITDIVKWDINETKQGGPFHQLSTDIDILVNDIYLSGKIEPFLTFGMIKEHGKTRRLTVFIDVSCDVTNPYNPFPINNKATTFDKPLRRVVEPSEENSFRPLDVCAIDHLPTMTPQESSQEFSSSLVTFIAELKNVDFNEEMNEENGNDLTVGTEGVRVWRRARSLYIKKSNELLQEVNQQ
ncbi:hypothetical protein ABK040_007231 [Willaertia magna]